MELSFVLAALRRRWWLVLVFLQIGLMPLYFFSGSSNEFESSALLEIREPDDQASFSGTPDRYLLSQLAVLNSGSMVASVAEAAGGEVSAGDVALATKIDHVPDTDVVSIVVVTGEPKTSQAIAQGFADEYLVRVIAEDESLRQPILASYSADLALATERLTVVNEELESAMRPFIDEVSNGGAIPDPSVIVPDLVVERDRLLAEISRLDVLRSEIPQSADNVNSRILQDAELPEAPVASGGKAVLIAFLIAFGLLGVGAAVMWARLSTKVLDDTAAAEILNTPVVTRTGNAKILRRSPEVALQQLPPDHVTAIDQVCVRAESIAKVNGPFVITVVGSQRKAGTTTLALSIASRMAAAEYSVLVVDADRRHPWLSDAFGTRRWGGIAALLGEDADRSDRLFSSSIEPDVQILGFGKVDTVLRRQLVPVILGKCREAADVVIVDGGPLLGAASTVEFCEESDAVVLAIPTAEQRADDLRAVGRQLQPILHKVVPVETAPLSAPAELIEENPRFNAKNLDRFGQPMKPVSSRRPPVADAEPVAKRRAPAAPEKSPAAPRRAVPDERSQAKR